jgi:hypothetical protein
VNISTVLGKIGLKIYDENENEVPIENINDKTNIMTILEIQGIKCSTRSFQIEMEMKQLMVLKPADLFEKCIIKTKSSSGILNNLVENNIIHETPIEECLENIESIESTEITEPTVSLDMFVNTSESEQLPENEREINIEMQDVGIIENNLEKPEKIEPIEIDGIQEIEFNLDDLERADEIQIKKRNDIYYEMYKEARRKAKIARDLALSSYLEVKRIKNTYMLDDIIDSDDSDLELDDEADIENDNDNHENDDEN